MHPNTINKLKFYYTVIALSQSQDEKDDAWKEVNKIAEENPDSMELILDLRLEVAIDLINEERRKKGLEPKEYVIVKPNRGGDDGT